jgi:hypothetical protein
MVCRKYRISTSTQSDLYVNPLPAMCPGGGMADAEDLKSSWLARVRFNNQQSCNDYAGLCTSVWWCKIGCKQNQQTAKLAGRIRWVQFWVQ